jgi:uncharacterized BrkB/YihY/UPF0761 family membrane protein
MILVSLRKKKQKNKNQRINNQIFFHTNSMKKEEIIPFIQEVVKTNRRMNPSVFAASLVYYFSIVALPIASSITYFKTLFETELQSGNGFFVQGIVFSAVALINVAWVSSKLLKANYRIGELLYQKKTIKNGFFLRLKAFGFTCLLFLFIFCGVILSSLFQNLIQSQTHFFLRFLLSLTYFLVQFFCLVMFNYFLYGYGLPKRSEKKKPRLWISFFVALCGYVLTILYQKYLSYFPKKSFQTNYGEYASLFILLLFVYWFCYIYILGMIMNYVLENRKMWNK